MPYKNVEDRKAWRERNREKLKGQKRSWWHKNKDRLTKDRRMRDAKLHAKFKQLIKELKERIYGNKCFLCKRTQAERRLELHEKYGKKHPWYYQKNTIACIEAHKEDFVLLCGDCHSMVTHLMKRFNLTWNEILARIPPKS